MRFWDSSAVVPLVVAEKASTRLVGYSAEPAPMYVWWSTRVEVTAALSRRERADAKNAGNWPDCYQSLHAIAEDWREIAPTDPVRRAAEGLVRRHDLRAADSLQLAAALVACEDHPIGHEFICLDERLRRAAAIEGFRLLPP